MTQGQTYTRIEDVLKIAKNPLAVHEFDNVRIEIPMEDSSDSRIEVMSGKQWVGVTESTLGRRLREMVGLKRVTKQRREGNAGFVEYSLAPKAEAVAA